MIQSMLWFYVLDLELMQKWVQILMGQAEILAPVSEGEEELSLEKLTDVSDLRLDFDTTTIPPTQKLFMPVGEKIVVLDLDLLQKWVQILMGQAEILAPVSEGEEKFSFEKLTDVSDLRLDYDTTTIPPTQKLFMPVGEKVIEWKKVNGKTVFTASKINPKQTIVFGIHPYDIHAISAWDDAIGQKQGALADPQYMAKRARTIIIGLDVLVPPPNSFCGSLRTHTIEKGFDLMLTDLQDGHYLVEAGTKKGEELMLLVDPLWKATPIDIERRDEVRRKIEALYPKTLPVPVPELHDFLEARIHHEYYKKTGELCVSCAKCTIVCPTCTCCNIHEEPALDGKSGARVRECDSCQLPSFTKMAGNVIARKDPGDLVRHRILDKLSYSHGSAPSCVGCGRCVAVCPASIADPVRALTLLKDEVSYE